ncbi:MAG: 30S ribosomal protein S12 methylthiotransferase RimO [Thermodesulfovibrionales bacterium]
MKANNKVSIITMGCPKNLVDSDNLSNLLQREGFLNTENLDEANIVLVNTCGFIEDAKRESIEEILRLKDIKRNGKSLLVFGCLAKRYREELMREIPEIDAIWGVGEEDGIVEYCKRTVKTGLLKKNEMPLIHPPSSSTSYAYIKIAEGCDRGCTFCVIPSIRGSYRSHAPEDVLKKAEEYVSSGVKELILVAQDISSYGQEFNGYDLSSLLKDITSISGNFWVRLLYLYPTSINSKLIETIAENEKICKYLDIPFQHSEDKILKAMGRKGGKRFYSELIKRLREEIPGITLRTTMIVGFPGETEEDFEGLKRFVEEMEFDRLGVFTYSREEGTRASRLRGHIPKKIKERRRSDIMCIQSRISLKKNLETVGRLYTALVDEINNDFSIARLYSQAPEIDGVVIIENREGLGVGNFVNVRIKEAFDYDLRGEVVR